MSTGAQSDNVQLLRRFYEAWDSEDVPTMLELIDPEFEYVNPPDAVHPGIRRGQEGLERVMEVFLESFDRMSHDLLEVHEIAPHCVLWHTIFRARGRDSGAEIAIDEQHVWTLRNGRILRLQWFHDLAAARGAAADSQQLPEHEQSASTRRVADIEVRAAISPQDEMFAEGFDEHYFRVGHSGLEAVRLALLAAGAEAPSRILDLPCGHGRVLRFLAAEYPQAEITACDLNRDGVDFCAQTFDAVPVYSSEDPSEIPLAGEYDLIWSGSLLTHLEAEPFIRFIELFERHLAEDGVLVFTVNGPCTAAMLEHTISAGEGAPDHPPRTPQDAYRIWARGYFGVPADDLNSMLDGYRREGFGYADYEWARERRREGRPGFGQCVSSPAWMCKQLDRFEDLRLVTYLEQGFDRVQDVVACGRPVTPEGRPMKGYHRLGRSLADRLRAGYAAWNETADIGAILAELDPGVEVVLPERGPEGAFAFRGHGGLGEWAKGMEDAWRTIKFEPAEIETDESAGRALVVVRVATTGRSSEVALAGTEAHVITVGDDGKVLRIQGYTDVDEARAEFARGGSA